MQRKGYPELHGPHDQNLPHPSATSSCTGSLSLGRAPLDTVLHRGCPRPDVTLGHSPEPRWPRALSRTDAAPAPLPRAAPPAVRCVRLVPSVGARRQHSTHSSQQLGWLGPCPKESACTASSQCHRAKIRTAGCMACNTNPVLYMGRQRLRES